MREETAEKIRRNRPYSETYCSAFLKAWRISWAYQAQRRSLPGFVANVAEFITSIRSGINFDALDQFHLPQTPTPILLFHGTGDTTTPVEVSDAFARAHADFVVYERVPNTEPGLVNYC